MNANNFRRIKEEEIAAITLLKNSGVNLLTAAQIAHAVIVRLRRNSLITNDDKTFEKRDNLITHCEYIIEAGIQTLALRERTVSLEEAGWASVEARSDCRPTTRRDLRYYLRRMLKVEGAAGLPLRAMSPRQCRELLQTAFGNCKSMYIKGRAMLHSIFAYGIRQEWCDTNPVARIEVPKVYEAPKEPLPLADVKRLQQVTEQPEFSDMKLSLNLMLYSGIRPAEVCRLRAEDFCKQEKVVIIRPQKSKTGGGRVVPLRGIRLLREQEWVIPANWQRKWRELRRAAGFTHWVPDVCRHTFASYHAAYFRNLPELQLEMGHRDSSLLRTRYMSPIRRKEARKYWSRCKDG